jgi:hypothetical protein
MDFMLKAKDAGELNLDRVFARAVVVTGGECREASGGVNRSSV